MVMAVRIYVPNLISVYNFDQGKQNESLAVNLFLYSLCEMLRLYNVTTAIPRYCSGQWNFHPRQERFEFHRENDEKSPACDIPAPRLIYGLQFKDYMDEIEENLFRQRFRRRETSADSDVITIQDIKDVALFTAPVGSVPAICVEFLHTETFDTFINDLIIYFEYFLKLVEFLMIRRDELKSKMRNAQSLRIERMLAAYLVQYRLILAREYSRIIMGTGDVSRFHHLANKSKQSNTLKDSLFSETVLSLCMRILWIAMHRKSYKVIDCELNRLFRSGHFNVAEKQLTGSPKYNFREQQLLYGPNDFRCNYRNQQSPLILEILNITPKNSDVLWIGEHKYRGTDPRMFQLELEYVTADAQLSFIDCHHGILGNPKHLYNTMLALDWHAVRREGYTKTYDPYRLMRVPCLEIPNYEDFIKRYPKNEPYFKIIHKKYEQEVAQRQCHVWKNRENIIRSTEPESLIDENIIQKCYNEVEALKHDIHIDRKRILANYFAEKQRKLKKSHS